jgi:hypothetical protein
MRMESRLRIVVALAAWLAAGPTWADKQVVGSGVSKNTSRITEADASRASARNAGNRASPAGKIIPANRLSGPRTQSRLGVAQTQSRLPVAAQNASRGLPPDVKKTITGFRPNAATMAGNTANAFGKNTASANANGAHRLDAASMGRIGPGASNKGLAVVGGGGVFLRSKQMRRAVP